MLQKLKKNQSHYYIAKNPPKPKTKIGQIWSLVVAKKYWVIGCSLFLIVAIVIGTLRQPPKDKAMASESAMVTAALKQNTEQKLELNSPFSLTLTMQNSSSTESLNNLKLVLNNTVNTVKWNTAQNLNLASSALKFEENTLIVPNLSTNERVEYEITGTLLNNQIPVLAIVGNLSYTNSQGKQATQTNRILNYLTVAKSPEVKLNLVSNKDKYEADEVVSLSVGRVVSGENTKSENTQKSSNNEPLQGKISIVNQKTQEQTALLDCQIKDQQCKVETKLKAGNYSGLFFEKNNYSTILEFKVGVETDSFVISSQANLVLPFGKSSANGQVAVIVNKVLSNNQEIKPNSECILAIIKDDKEISQVKTPILQDKSCRLILDNLENGNYQVALAGTNLKENFEFVKTEKNLELKNRNTTFEKNKNIELIADNLKEKIQTKTENSSQNSSENKLENSSTESQNSSQNNSDPNIDFGNSSISNSNIDLGSSASNQSVESQAEVKTENPEVKNLNNLKTSLFIFHTNSGDFKELKSLENELIMIKNGELKLNIPSSNFVESGNYKIWTQTENGENSLNSQIISVDFGDKSVGIAGSGITFDYSDLVAGQEMNFKIQNLTDSSGNSAKDGVCGANLYLAGQKNSINKNGEIKNATCEVRFGKDEVKIAGFALITFATENPINQSRQIEILPNKTITLGRINAEYEPIRKDFANTMLLGPATDTFGNLANLENMTLELTTNLPIDQNPNIDTGKSQSITKNTKNDKDPRNSNSNTSTRLINNISIQNGFAKVEIPASFLSFDNLKFRLIDENKQEFLSQSFDLVANNGKLILPTFPNTLKTEENLKAAISGILLKDTEIKDYKCELILVNNNTQNVKTEVDFDKNGKKCNFDWNLETSRNQPKALVKMKINNEQFSKIIELEATNGDNLFTTNIQTQLNEKREIILNLLTSPIFDKYGLLLNNSKINWQYNGKKAENLVQNGIAKLEITSDKLTGKDYKATQNKKTLDLDIDVKAGTNSISKTNNLSIFLQDLEITKESQKVTVEKMSNVLVASTNQLLQFQSKTCSVITLKNGKPQKVLSHWQNGSCFVQVVPISGNYNLIFEKDGFESGNFGFRTGPKSEVKICEKNKVDPKTVGCLIQVAGATGEILIKIIDESKEYKFTNKELENAVLVNQNGLNSNKKYLMQVSFENENKQKVLWQEQVLGELFN